MSKPAVHIVKRATAHSEPYDERKVYASVYASCLSVRTPAGEAELTAAKVCEDIAPWLHTKQEVTSADIRRRAAIHLNVYNPHAAYIYLHHRVMA